MFLNLKMEQIPVKFKDAEICYYNRNATYGQKAFKAISCLIDIRADLNGNDWNDSWHCSLKLVTDFGPVFVRHFGTKNGSNFGSHYGRS